MMRFYPHVLFGDISRYALKVISDNREKPKYIIDMMEEIYREGDEKSQELVYVSFLENIIWEEGYKELKESFVQPQEISS